MWRISGGVLWRKGYPMGDGSYKAGVKVAGSVWAPVNCGYHSEDYKYGKLYQWGRKYGQGWGDSGDSDRDETYPSGSNLVNGPVSNSIGNSSSNRDKFYKNENKPYDWCSPKLSEWSSEYDPCPAGWRVPTKAELEKLKKHSSSWTTNNGQNGRWFSGDKSYSSSGVNKIFFPAVGYRSYDGGAKDRGSEGSYWSSSVNGTSAYYLGFGDGYVNMYYYRAYGYPVRCVEDL